MCSVAFFSGQLGSGFFCWKCLPFGIFWSLRYSSLSLQDCVLPRGFRSDLHRYICLSWFQLHNGCWDLEVERIFELSIFFISFFEEFQGSSFQARALLASVWLQAGPSGLSPAQQSHPVQY